MEGCFGSPFVFCKEKPLGKNRNSAEAVSKVYWMNRKLRFKFASFKSKKCSKILDV